MWHQLIVMRPVAAPRLLQRLLLLLRLFLAPTCHPLAAPSPPSPTPSAGWAPSSACGDAAAAKEQYHALPVRHSHQPPQQRQRQQWWRPGMGRQCWGENVCPCCCSRCQT